jgi:hypothetical protein
LPVPLAAVLALGAAAFALAAATALILPTHTPGARYSRVRQGTISTTICVKAGRRRSVRRRATRALSSAQLAQWHYADQNPSHYEEDHLISLELGGAPWSTRNLWPEPHSQSVKSDPLENARHRMVCDGMLTLKQARAQELAYKRKHG